jgi:hypothetical protein
MATYPHHANTAASDRPHWKDPAYKVWASATYSTEDYAPLRPQQVTDRDV